MALFKIYHLRRLPLLVAGRRLRQPVHLDFSLATPRTDQIVAFEQDVQHRQLSLTPLTRPVKHHGSLPSPEQWRLKRGAQRTTKSIAA
jgi:hypothetical protein